jgi:hypothetical protein
MTAPTDNPDKPMWHPETFSEPRTVPKKWDVSALQPPPLPPYQGGSGGILRQPNDSEYHPDPFPEPRTFPTQWDVSELT